MQHYQCSVNCFTPIKVRGKVNKHNQIVNKFMERTETLGDRVRRLRTARDMTQQELAEKIGLSYPSVNEIENGVTLKPRRGTLLKLGDFFGVSAEYLLTGQQKAAPSGPFLPGGTLNNFGATVHPPGGLRAALGENFGEDVGQPMHAPGGKPVKTQQDFIQGLLAEIDALKGERKNLMAVISEQRESLREQREMTTFLREQVQQLQLQGKHEGNHYEAPGDYLTQAAEPVTPIGFQVRQMYPNGLPDVEVGESMRVAA